MMYMKTKELGWMETQGFKILTLKTPNIIE